MDLIKQMNPKTYKSIRLSFYIFIIFAAGMSSAVLTQKIYKTPYIRNNTQQSNKTATEADYFSNPFGIPLFNGFFALCYGIFMYQILHHNNQYRERQQRTDYYKQFMKLAAVNNIIDLSIGLAIILTSFTTINLVNCCKLLAVVLFAVFFSKASDKYKVQKRQILIAVLISMGIIIFNVFAQRQKSGVNNPLNVWTTLLIIGILMIQGYQPELTSQIREKYSPPASLIYYQVSKYSFIFMLIAAAVSTQLWNLVLFIWQHDRLPFDLMLHSILDVIGTIFIYRVMIAHKQHIVPMITTIRKLLTGIFNIYYFNHQVNNYQYCGLAVVFFAILLQLYINYKVSEQKFKQIEDAEPEEPYYDF